MDVQDQVKREDKMLDQTEVMLGDHVTGGVVQSWRKVQRILGNALSEGKYPLHKEQLKLNWPDNLLCPL